MLDPYRMSQKIEGLPEPVLKSISFPWLLVSRWLVGAVLLVFGLIHSYYVTTGWAVLADRAIIEPGSSPRMALLMGLCMCAAGLLLIFRSKWVYVPILLHIAISLRGLAVLYVSVSVLLESLPYIVSPLLMMQLGLLSFCLLLSLKGRLR